MTEKFLLLKAGFSPMETLGKSHAIVRLTEMHNRCGKVKPFMAYKVAEVSFL